MPSTPTPGRVYKTTPAQRARAAAQRRADPERSLAYGRAQTARLRSSFVGPRRPRGRQRLPGLTKKQQAAQEAAGRRQARERMKAAEAVIRALRRLAVHRQRLEAVEARELGRAGKAWDRQAVQVVRKASKFVMRPPKLPRSIAPAPQALSRPPAPPKPSRALLAAARAAARAEAAQAKAQAVADAAAAKAMEKAGRQWDRESIKVLRQTAKLIREQVREAAQIAAKSRTPEQIAASRAAYEAAMQAMSQWSAEQRQVSEDRRNAFRRRTDAEQARMDAGAAAVPAAASRALQEAAAVATLMRAPVRRTPITP